MCGPRDAVPCPRHSAQEAHGRRLRGWHGARVAPRIGKTNGLLLPAPAAVPPARPPLCRVRHVCHATAGRGSQDRSRSGGMALPPGAPAGMARRPAVAEPSPATRATSGVGTAMGRGVDLTAAPPAGDEPGWRGRWRCCQGSRSGRRSPQPNAGQKRRRSSYLHGAGAKREAPWGDAATD